MSKLEAVLFDLDGVIVDTAKHHYRAWKELANELGFDFTEEDNERLKGVSRVESLNILLEIGQVEKTEKEKEELAARKNQRYVEAISTMDESEILPGVIDFLQELKNENVPFALGSASKNAPAILKHIKLFDAFDAIVDGNSIAKAKPDPEVFLQGADKLGANYENCVVFEDAQSGIEAGKAAGMYVVGVGSADVLKGADDYITHMTEMNVERIRRK
ncbi:beta-phosphoglucomutase [Salisediminibacterium beveridgei]|uniref:Beta-phosphoglucomutase n=1 Tax=Salisediminibacterium beveridgei TaxID=632773 RepID=A0A1D7QV86_9BACI|nr:beta-phosphoglucomutase [Salisediminibacterium beveridgei]AOM82878.1 Beta-phosphoglucomutase [Salisediminibacterium beveridgei]